MRRRKQVNAGWEGLFVSRGSDRVQGRAELVTNAPSHFNDHVLFFDRDGGGLGDVRSLDDAGAFDHLDRVFADADLGGVAETLAGAHVKLPPVPGAAQDFTLARVAVVAWFVGFDEAGQDTFTHR